ncbi:hypothetical protein BGX31_003555, partial [Mortierella sp. GBA43]
MKYSKWILDYRDIVLYGTLETWKRISSQFQCIRFSSADIYNITTRPFIILNATGIVLHDTFEYTLSMTISNSTE